MIRLAIIFATLALTASEPTLAAGEADKGEALFARCSACHAITSQNKVGPSLQGVVGRTAGTIAGFRYSKAMAASGIIWSEGTLDTYLTAPGKMVPGTLMTVNMLKAQDRLDIVAYLKTLTAP